MRRIALAVVVSLAAVNGFTTYPTSHDGSLVLRSRPLRMVATSADNFGDDSMDRMGRGRDKAGKRERTVRSVQEDNTSKFVTGDKLHKLRHQVLAMRLELQEARRSGSKERVRELERAIMKAQQVDAEFVYTVSLERVELAEQKGLFQDAEKFRKLAKEARSALPHFNLEGLWVGKYGDHGYEMINVTYHGDVLIAQKVTGTKNVPKGQVTFEVDLTPEVVSSHTELLEPIELGENAARQWGCKYLQRFSGRGQVAAEGYLDSQWVDGQLIMVNEYFSFAWLPIGHQVFFGRPTPELILKLLKEETKKETGDSSARAYLERCWEETENIEDEYELSEGAFNYMNEQDYYHQEGCFE